MWGVKGDRAGRTLALLALAQPGLRLPILRGLGKAWPLGASRSSLERDRRVWGKRQDQAGRKEQAPHPSQYSL